MPTLPASRPASTPPIDVELQPAGPGQGAPTQFRPPVWPAVGQHPAKMIPALDEVPPPEPPPIVPASDWFDSPPIDAGMSDDVADRIVALLAIIVESQREFEEAAEAVDETTVHGLMVEIAEQRHAFVKQLEPFVIDRGWEPDRLRTARQRLHEWWTRARRLVGQPDPQSVLREAERGERAIEQAYADTLQQIPPGAVRDRMMQQRLELLVAHQRILSLMAA